jgi:hypothetical protein
MSDAMQVMSRIVDGVRVRYAESSLRHAERAGPGLDVTSNRRRNDELEQ